MQIRYNVEKLEKIIRDFHMLTGISIAVRDTEFRLLAESKSQELNFFCNLIQSTHAGMARCLASDGALLCRCKECGHAVTHLCHAGLTDTVVPIVSEDTLLGFILFGQVGDRKEDFSEIRRRLMGLDIEEGILRRAYEELTFFDRSKIESAAEVVSMLTKYIWLENTIRILPDSLFEQARAYIAAHLHEPLGLAVLCHHFNVSKNTLYKAFAEAGCTVIAYITNLRLAEAERLLRETERPVYEICEQVGIDNYHYFCRLFKKKRGTTPLGYRRGFRDSNRL